MRPAETTIEQPRAYGDGKPNPAVDRWDAGEDRVCRLSHSQVVAIAAAVTLGLAVAGYGLAGSYVTVSALAARRGVPLAGLVPAGIDGGVLAVVVMDLVLVWVGAPVAWLRQLVRVLAMGTIAANLR